MNILETIKEFLCESGSGLYGSNVNRICIGKLPVSFKNTESAIIIQMQSMESALNKDIFNLQAVFRIYGGSDKFEDVLNLFSALHEKLQAGHTKESIILAHLITANMTYDPDTNWPVVYAQYNVKMAG